MFKMTRLPRALAFLALGFATLSTAALADPYGYGGPYGGNGGYGRPTYGGEGRPYGQPPRSYGDAGHHGPNGYNGSGRHPQYGGNTPPQYRPPAYNGGPAPQPYPGPRTYYPQGANAPQAVPNRAPGYGGPANPPVPQPAAAPQPRAQQPAPAPAPAASGQPTYVYVVFQQSATAVETATFLKTYNLVVDDGPSNDGFFQLRVVETLPDGQLKEMVESMRTQTKVVSRVES